MPTPHRRVNIVVTNEQYALLSELATLDEARSVAAIVRELVDQVTPLLRVTVPAMRAAKEELDTNRESLRKPLAEMVAAIEQLSLPEASSPTPRRSGTAATTGARTAPPKRRRAPRQSSAPHPQGQ